VADSYDFSSVHTEGEAADDRLDQEGLFGGTIQTQFSETSGQDESARVDQEWPLDSSMHFSEMSGEDDAVAGRGDEEALSEGSDMAAL